MIERLVLFGASGDLAGRYLLPALAELRAKGQLADDFRVVGAARQEWSDADFRAHAAARLERHAGHLPATAREDLVGLLSYRWVDLANAASVGAAIGPGREPIAAYLALPPGLFSLVVGTLAAAGLPLGSRIAVEKPFGEDLDGARELNRLLVSAAGDEGESAIFRVDHVLGMATTQRLLELRLGGGALEALWRTEHIERVELLWEETLALEGRVGYFDGAGMLKDVVQNHLLQLLCIVAMEPPAEPIGELLRDAKVDALRSVRIPEHRSSRRARYDAGRIGEREIPSYADEEGVDPGRETETLAEITLEIESEHWRGTRFVLRGGKALRRRRKGVLLHFRSGEEMWIGIDGPEDVVLELGRAPSSPPGAGLSLVAPPPEAALPAYARVLLAILEGESALSVRGDEAEEAWRVVAPVLAEWEAGRPPLGSYPAGSDGP